MQYQEGLVLEIIKRERSLAMSLFEPRELTSTLRHSCQCSVSFPEVGRLCREIITILNKANKKGVLTDEALNNLKKTGHLLWSHVLAHPVRQRLKNAGHIDLTFFLDEELISIPWELLYDGHEFFCLDFNVGRLVRTHVEKVAAAGYRDVANVPRMLILSNPTNDLKSSYSEGMTIRRELDNKRDHIRVDFKSTHIDRMYVRKHLADYDIVHFAGHCEYDPRDQDNTGWLLHDGRFTTSDILSLGSSLTLPTLVFSNGCHSAHASLDLIEADYQQKNYSLASAFLFSGVRHYIGAIRKIEDVISFDFAREFYNQLISGRSVGESLRLSRFKLIRERGMKAILWAGYILYGNPSAVIFPPSPAKKPDSAPRLKPPERRAPGIGVFLRKKLRLRRIAAVGAAVILLSAAYALLPVKNPRVYLRYRKAQNLFNLGRNEEALRHAREIVERHPRFLSIYPILADTYHRLGNKEQALTYYFEYALQSEKQNAPRHLAKAYSSIGWYYHIEGEYEKGRGFYDKAIEISRAHKDRLNEAIALRRLAVWHIDREEYDEALSLLTKSSEINREREHSPEHRYNLACDYFDIGLVFTNKDDYAAARKFYNKSRRIFEKLNLCSELSDCYFNLGELYLYEKQYQKALDYYLKGLRIDEEQKNVINLASDHLMIGELFIEMERWPSAREHLEKSVRLAKEIDSAPDLAEAWRALGGMYTRMGQKTRARECLRKAQEIYYQIDMDEYERVKKALINL